LKRIPSLDGFRAIAILLVLFCHSRLSKGFPAGLTDVARLSEVGVTVFFVISGFLITSLLVAEDAKNGRINLRNFYTRRILRIFPVYFLFVAFIMLWGNIEKLGITNNNLLHAFTFTVNFDQNPNWFLGHFWSLGVEEQFYIFWPVILIVFRKRLKIIFNCLFMPDKGNCL
jgi:peptidoglycan/LPS O-acetylase OafA/YrhL